MFSLLTCLVGLISISRYETKSPCLMNLWLMVDDSGSIKPNEFVNLKESLMKFLKNDLEQLRTTVNGVFIIFYSLGTYTTTQIHGLSQKRQTEKLDVALDFINSYEQRGGHSCVETTLNHIKNDIITKYDKNKKSGITDLIMIFSDGKSHCNPRAYESIRNAMANLKMTIFPVGYGHQIDLNGLEFMTSLHGRYIPSFNNEPSFMAVVNKSIDLIKDNCLNETNSIHLPKLVIKSNKSTPCYMLLKFLMTKSVGFSKFDQPINNVTLNQMTTQLVPSIFGCSRAADYRGIDVFGLDEHGKCYKFACQDSMIIDLNEVGLCDKWFKNIIPMICSNKKGSCLMGANSIFIFKII